MEKAYEIVLSFAGEDREYVEGVAQYLTDNNVEVFYDKHQEVVLWGTDLSEYFGKIYRGGARYCVMFISKHYANKAWPIYERQSALAKAIIEKIEYILPAQFDDTEIPGIRPTMGYVDLSEKTPEQLGTMILQKLGKLNGQTGKTVSEPSFADDDLFLSKWEKLSPNSCKVIAALRDLGGSTVKESAIKVHLRENYGFSKIGASRAVSDARLECRDLVKLNYNIYSGHEMTLNPTWERHFSQK